MVGLGAALLLVFNLPDPAARGVKSAVREALAPYQNALASAGRWLPGRSGGTAPREGAASPDARLQRLETLERENDELRRLLGLERRLAMDSVGASVLARDGASGWWRTVRLNRGTRDGVSTNQVVISEKGLVGVIREATPHTSDVLLITDPGCRLAVRCNRTADFGLLQGGGVVAHEGALEMLLPAEPAGMTFIPRDSSIRAGDEIITSGLGGVFPEGLPVGVVTAVEKAHSGLYLNARVAPAADLARLRHVLVLKDSPERRAGP